MWINVGIGMAVAAALFLGYVSTREGTFRYERSGVIDAPASSIFPYISHLKLGAEWSPYEKKDPNLKREFSGVDGEVGSKMEFTGNNEAGSGSIQVLKIVPNERVDLKLVMTKPIHAENLIEYTLTEEGSRTRFTWTMSGDGGFLTKLMTTLIDCEKMIAGEFVVGIENLKKLVESQPR